MVAEVNFSVFRCTGALVRILLLPGGQMNPDILRTGRLCSSSCSQW
jgi:hypothetical protein